MFETFIVQPVFNLLLILYAIFGDFGIAIILFTLLIRVLMWPLLKKQLHQSKLMRKLQPEIKKIRKKHKKDKQAEVLALQELYKEKGINPAGTFGLLLVQLPVFFGLFSALRSFISDPERLIRLPYAWIRDNSAVTEMLGSVAEKTNQALNTVDEETRQRAASILGDLNVEIVDLVGLGKDSLHTLFTDVLTTTNATGVQENLVVGPFFDQKLFGFIDLSGRAFNNGDIYLPVLIIAILAGVFQYISTKQIMPASKSDKGLRQIMAEAAKTGKEPEQEEISAAIGKKMGLFFAPLITIISATSPSGLALYFAASGLIGMIQQRVVLTQDVEEMEEIADEATNKKPKKKSKNKKNNTKNRKGKKKKSQKSSKINKDKG